MTEYLSLSEMANRLGFTPKTFAKYVTQYQIPHLALGNRKRFDAVAVEAFLAARLSVRDTVATFKRPVRKSQTKQSRFAEVMGI